MCHTITYRIILLINLMLYCCVTVNASFRMVSIQQIADTLPKLVPDTTSQIANTAKHEPLALQDTSTKTIIPDTTTISKKNTDTNSKADTIIQQTPAVVTSPASAPTVETKPSQISTAPTLRDISADTMRLDTIIKKSGGRMKVKIEGRNLFEIMFKMPGQKITKKMSTSSISELRYANGKIEIIDNNPEKRPKDWVPAVSEREYVKIVIAKDEAEVANLVEKGEIEANYVSNKMMTNNRFLERNALVILRKKAVYIKATTILVTYKDITREYSEYPSIRMTATAYGTENNEE